MSNRARAISEWASLLGEDRVEIDPEGKLYMQPRTFGDGVAIIARLYPSSPGLVAQCLEVASRYGIGMHPVSRGANWGMGSQCPTVTGAAILDLSRMDKISGFDADQGCVHIEPGVTFTQLFTFMQGKTDDYFLPTIGGSVKASVLANALDRGDATFCDRWATLMDLEVVLADGRLVRTGHSPHSDLIGSGIAPAGGIIEGLFSQSNLGIVVGGWLQLSPIANSISAFLLPIGSRDRLPSVISAWRNLQRSGVLAPRSFTLWNGIKFLAKQNIRASYTEERIANAQLDDWYLSGFVVAETPEVLALREQLVNDALAPLVEEVMSFPVRQNGEWSEEGKEIFAVPKQVNLRTVYWRHPSIPELEDINPDTDGCGLIWLCLAMPLDGEKVQDFAMRCHAFLEKAGIDFNIGLEAPNFRASLTYLTLSYDRFTEGADALAQEAYMNILEMALDEGYAPYRLANGMPLPPRLQESSRNQLLREIRHLVDPEHIISDGRAGI